MEEKVKGIETEADVLPFTVDGDQWLRLRPGKEVVMVAIKHGVSGLRGRWLRRDALVEFVPVVTNAHLIDKI